MAELDLLAIGLQVVVKVLEFIICDKIDLGAMALRYVLQVIQRIVHHVVRLVLYVLFRELRIPNIIVKRNRTI